jgi:hypothetical protein
VTKRFYLAPVVGSGTDLDPYRAKVPSGTNYVTVIPSKPDGTPAFPWCVVRVARASGLFVDLDADADVDRWPDFPLDTMVRDIPVAERTRLADALTRRGIDTSDVVGTTTLRQILRRVGRLLDARFSEIVTDVRE